MKKIIMMLLVLAGGISTASAYDDFWIVGEGITNPVITWGATNDAWKMTRIDDGIYTLTVPNVTFEEAATIKFKARNKISDWDGATSFGYPKSDSENVDQVYSLSKGGTYDLFFYLNVNEKRVRLIILNNLQLKGSFEDWSGTVMESDGGFTYHYTIDLTEKNASQTFKFFVDVPGYNLDDNADTDYPWIGNDKVDISNFTANPGVLSVSGTDYQINQNIVKGYTKFDVIAKWMPGADIRYNWKVTITPTEPRDGVSKILYENTKEWANVYAYSYQDADDSNKNADWPGEVIAKFDGLYTFFYTTPTSYDKIIFNNGNSGGNNQTQNLSFLENGIYNFSGNVTDVTVSAGTNGMATFSSAFPLDFSYANDISAYIITELSPTAATLEPVDYAVPAATGLLITGNKNASEAIPTVQNANPIVKNFLQAAVYGYAVGNEVGVYVLSSGKFVRSLPGQIPAGKAYLLASDIPSEARSLSLVFADDETTGIQSVDKAANENVIYNLAGQRVTAPANGLFIMNGKKIIVK